MFTRFMTTKKYILSSLAKIFSDIGFIINCMFFRIPCVFITRRTGYVYDVFQDRVTPRYKIDKGNYSADPPKEEFMHLKKYRGIAMHFLNETDKYVIGVYNFGNRYYYFGYDKKSHVTKNFKLVDDDLLKTGITKSTSFPSKYFSPWHNKMQFPTDYLYFFFTPARYAKLIEHIRSRLSEKEWEAYKEEHVDLMKIYDGLDENSNTIILGLKFK